MEILTDPQAWIAFLTLFSLELVLGVDNVIFISILASRLPAEQQKNARRIGLAMAVISRILLLFSLAWIVSLTNPLFTLPVFKTEISGRDLILLIGGLFLIAKSTHEIHHKLEGEEGHGETKVKPSFSSFLVQVLMLDVVFSLDSVITAVGMVDQRSIMIAAVLASAAVMIVSANAISGFVERHPTVKMLALSFLLLIGFTLILEGFDTHVPKGYIYFAMAFSVMVELLNLKMRSKHAKPVKLHEPYSKEELPGGKA